MRLSVVAFILCVGSSHAFGILSYHRPYAATFSRTSAISMSEETAEPESEKAEMKQKVTSLVADDEWMGLSMELSELVRIAVIEDVKKNTRDFTGSGKWYCIGSSDPCNEP